MVYGIPVRRLCNNNQLNLVWICRHDRSWMWVLANRNAANEMLRQECCEWNATTRNAMNEKLRQEMLLQENAWQKCCEWNATTGNATTEMLWLKCYELNATTEMLRTKCHDRNATTEKLQQECYPQKLRQKCCEWWLMLTDCKNPARDLSRSNINICHTVVYSEHCLTPEIKNSHAPITWIHSQYA